ncbi:helix-turn-helix domain-containing protein, partial [Aquisphaera insulae]|uniref:helix-turn-helix domain-containing protein n=1 Tax=Aquisphaera insulae TaxID=2712864 RepID=UPI0013EC473D
MPRPTDLSLRLAIARMAQLEASPPEIARRLGLPVSTVRDLVRRASGAGTGGPSPADLRPGYRAGERLRPTPPLLQGALDLRRSHPRWGSGRIRVELARTTPAAEVPSDRTLRRWLNGNGLAPAPPGRPRAESRRRSARPHEVWQVDAADQKRLATGAMISWLRVADECSGAALHSRVFPPGLFHPGAPRAGAGRAPRLLRPLGPAGVDPVRQRQPLGLLRRPAD